MNSLTISQDTEDDRRIAIYSATFASSIGSHIYCPDYGGGGVGGDLESDSVGGGKCSDSSNEATTGAIMDHCHGKSKTKKIKKLFSENCVTV